ncbi:hypothetical protein SAMN05444417_0815 [Wenxinia saemankumensis]|uniref:Uncharacterized protein n=1 Tax=Wenxinia saemankumensis TaxID=1447782 RepID=A0A1M6BRS0_9RHOB|nr:hypothetical protein SAMN05444417_0815 [Wenxinia saemankumensis]
MEPSDSQEQGDTAYCVSNSLFFAFFNRISANLVANRYSAPQTTFLLFGEKILMECDRRVAHLDVPIAFEEHLRASVENHQFFIFWHLEQLCCEYPQPFGCKIGHNTDATLILSVFSLRVELQPDCLKWQLHLTHCLKKILLAELLNTLLKKIDAGGVNVKCKGALDPLLDVSREGVITIRNQKT